MDSLPSTGRLRFDRPSSRVDLREESLLLLRHGAVRGEKFATLRGEPCAAAALAAHGRRDQGLAGEVVHRVDGIQAAL